MKKLLSTIAILSVFFGAVSITYAACPSGSTCSTFGSFITGLSNKSTPASNDIFYLNDVSGGNADKSTTFSNIQSALTIPVGQVTGTLPVSKGGTGATTLTGCLQGNGTSAITATGVACGSGGGSAGGTWSTTTSTVAGHLDNYSNNATDVVVIGGNSTTSAPIFFDPNAGATSTLNKVNIGSALIDFADITNLYFGNPFFLLTNSLLATNPSGQLISTTTPYANNYVATSTKASVLPYASTTAVTVSGAKGLNLASLATSAGTFVAVDPTGAVIATTTPSGGGGGSGTVTTITAGTGITLSSGATCTTTCTITSTGGGGTVIPAVDNFRLSASSTSALPNLDVPSSGILYLEQYNGAHISTYDSSAWADHATTTPARLSLTLTSGKVYDVFAFATGNNINLELSSAWATNNSRTDALAQQDGIWVKSADHSRRLLGTIYATTTNTIQDSAAFRYVSNLYNTAPRSMASNPGVTHTYSTSAYQEWNAGVSAPRLNFVLTMPNQAINVIGAVNDLSTNSNNTTGTIYSETVSLDGTTSISPGGMFDEISTPANAQGQALASTYLRSGMTSPSEGFHFVTLTEYAYFGTLTTGQGETSGIINN